MRLDEKSHWQIVQCEWSVLNVVHSHVWTVLATVWIVDRLGSFEDLCDAALAA
jgi:hypothetical protein